MGITILKWIIFIVICVGDFIAYVLDKFNHEQYKILQHQYLVLFVE